MSFLRLCPAFLNDVSGRMRGECCKHPASSCRAASCFSSGKRCLISQLRSGIFLISRNRMVAMQFPLLISMALLLLGASPSTSVSEAVDAHTQTYRPASRMFRLI